MQHVLQRALTLAAARYFTFGRLLLLLLLSCRKIHTFLLSSCLDKECSGYIIRGPLYTKSGYFYAQLEAFDAFSVSNDRVVLYGNIFNSQFLPSLLLLLNRFFCHRYS
jgi:hypothetical protein